MSLNPQPDEILICIGKSSDNTEALVWNFVGKISTPVEIYYDRDGIGTGYAMNILTSAAKGDIILWIDADMYLPTNWVELVRKLFAEYNLKWLLGKPYEILPEVLPSLTDYQVDIDKLNFEFGRNPTGGLTAFSRREMIELGNFDSFFVRGQDLDATLRFMSAKDVGGTCRSVIHAGLEGGSNFKKVLTRQTFWKFFYKYGLKYCLIDKHHSLAASLRTVFVLSLIGAIVFSFFNITVVIALLFINFLSIASLAVGVHLTYGRISENLLLLQLVGSFGEFYQLFSVIFKKDKLKFGYGAKWLK
jgi:glycosyltransferase involved in cell wall biosynthesis